MKQWFLRHWASDSKGQWFLRDRKYWGEPIEHPRLLPWESFQVMLLAEGTQVKPSGLPVLGEWIWDYEKAKVVSVCRERESSIREELWKLQRVPSLVFSWVPIHCMYVRKLQRTEKNATSTPDKHSQQTRRKGKLTRPDKGQLWKKKKRHLIINNVFNGKSQK